MIAIGQPEETLCLLETLFRISTNQPISSVPTPNKTNSPYKKTKKKEKLLEFVLVSSQNSEGPIIKNLKENEHIEKIHEDNNNNSHNSNINQKKSTLTNVNKNINSNSKITNQPSITTTSTKTTNTTNSIVNPPTSPKMTKHMKENERHIKFGKNQTHIIPTNHNLIVDEQKKSISKPLQIDKTQEMINNSNNNNNNHDKFPLHHSHLHHHLVVHF